MRSKKPKVSFICVFYRALHRGLLEHHSIFCSGNFQLFTAQVRRFKKRVIRKPQNTAHFVAHLCALAQFHLRRWCKKEGHHVTVLASNAVMRCHRHYSVTLPCGRSAMPRYLRLPGSCTIPMRFSSRVRRVVFQALARSPCSSNHA